jgi:hypothetical protein
MTILILIIWMHWLADFVLQTDSMAKNKSTSWKWLSAHIAVYTLPFFIFGWRFAIFNGLVHMAIDAITSRITSKLWKKQQVHNFFVVIGLDQALHMTTLILSAQYFGVIK